MGKWAFLNQQNTTKESHFSPRLEQDSLVHEFLSSNIRSGPPLSAGPGPGHTGHPLCCAKMKNSNRSSIEPLPLHNMHSLISAVNQLRDFSGVKQANPKRIHQIKDQFRLHLPG